MPTTTPALTTLDVTIRAMHDGDLWGMGWSGTPGHVKQLADQLTRARAGVADYLVACLPSGQVIGKGGVDYEPIPGAGALWQFAVLEPLRSCGIGSALIRECERRIQGRGLRRAEIDVEEDNPRARLLYERLGYVAYGRKVSSWDDELPDGTVTRIETTCVLLRKDLTC
ncbi:GNAT family N-acetyltransferase [Actinopolymorpha pittospori]|uniref:Ribosomal protein S18 acetylase RimI-like enzyme n=1 Tax=Actinopolymorpha pittospori TaxID=648752 RepID=A0A927RKP9_9ACTN|nr:GNAT family N-acetyltransferase [Actinopolymorpha pittospori]MBE1608461.1 ribosomal protein S18 acetylase RimI-like enzyme [Actinopolymorpha pittospori]